MTAGHNLVKSSKALNDPVIRPAAVTLTFPGKKAPYTTKPEQWKVNEIYERNPVDENAVHDYALIAVDMNETAIERGGFAYTLRVTEEVIIHSQVHVYGYRANMQPGEELHPEGNKGWARVRGNQILYGIATEGGVSGGPVWIRHRTGDDTVVGIQ